MSLVEEFLESLSKPVAELPDIELADLGEDSKASWLRNEPGKVEELNKVEFLKRRLNAAQELENGRYRGKVVSSKSVFSGFEMNGFVNLRSDAKPETDESIEKDEKSEDDIDDESIAHSSALDQDLFPDYSGHSGDDDGDDGDDDNETEKEPDIDEDSSAGQKKDFGEEVIMKVPGDTQLRKAGSVRKQLLIWDRLMQLHILSHAALRLFNQLPRGQYAKQLQRSVDDVTIRNCRIMRRNMRKLIFVFEALEDLLLRTSKQTKHLITGGDIIKETDEEIESTTDEDHENDEVKMDNMDVEDAEERYDVSLSVDSTVERNEMHDCKQLRDKKKIVPLAIKEWAMRHERFMPFRLSTLAKWDEKTKLTAVGTSKNKKKDFSAFEFGILKQIEQIMSEKHRLIRRTQLKRYDVDRMGNEEDGNYDAEIFDDDDFYQQLLKELIERKTVGVMDPIEMSRQWLEIQKLRQKRSKRKKVDTKASKGRKIRYMVIPELINFFPSMPETVKWTDESRNQLFKSLFVV